MQGDAFGFPRASATIDPDDPFADPPETPAEPVAPTEPAAPAPEAVPPTGQEPAPVATEPPAPVPPEGQPTEAAPTEPAVAETPEQAAARRWAGQFGTPEELEAGFEQLRAHQNRTFEENQQLRGYLQRAQQLLSQPAPAPAQPAQPQPVAPLDPRLISAAAEMGLDENALRLVQGLAAQETERRVAGAQQEWQGQLQQIRAQDFQQMQGQQAVQAANASVASFFARHPEITPGSEMDSAITGVCQSLDLDISDGPTLDLAHELATDADLFGVFRAQPDLIDSSEGIDTARAIAEIRKVRRTGQPPAATPGAPATVATPAQALPHVESGSPGSAPGGTTPAVPDPNSWDAVLAEGAGKKSVFGV